MFQDNSKFFLKFSLSFVLGQEEYVEASMGRWQFARVAMLLDQEIERLKTVDWYPVSASHESQKPFLFLMIERMYKLPKMP